ncbi:MAG: tetratricopeptide repeat protein [Vitreoscilla sp.]|nr:tetratricopeptide repeat protein [Burkholderiales bacterium]MBP6336037.1 tetratricopeptide repeat protein [Vitreoscilla sp.]MBP6673705.1 tetratricopeptide repeat protein [Vitreoscilla sp.]
MASNLDLQEQEQLDELKAFWKQYGNLITWVLTLVLAGFAGVNGWNYWQGKQAVQAGAMFEELDKAAQAGDAERVARVFGDMKDRFGRTTLAWQGGLLAAKLQAEKGKLDDARASLVWVAEHAGDEGYKATAHLRLAGLLVDSKAYDEALKQLDAVTATEFAALAQDRRGDVLAAQGKKAEAAAAWQAAWKAMDEKLDYRRVVEAKLNTVGQSAEAAADKPAAAASGAAQ